MARQGLAALRHPLPHDRLAGLLAELEKERGPVPQEVMEEVRQPAVDSTPKSADAAERLKALL